MKLSFIIVMVLLISAQLLLAASGKGQSLQKIYVKLELHNETLKTAIKQIEEQSELRFAFKEGALPLKAKIDLSAEKNVKEILDEIFGSRGIAFTQMGNSIILFNHPGSEADLTAAKIAILNRSVTISGTVTDEANHPLRGATIQIKGTAIVTQTNISGHYTINSPDDNPILVFSFVGYDSQELMLNGRTTIDIQMKPTANSLNEIVVVGYGTQKKVDVTGAVASANLEDFRNAPNTNIVQVLQGTVPGLNIGQVNSAGATPSISIRGNNTISGNSKVLIILDGIQYNGSFEALNPDDIASIDVLKDASATAVYGAQAANGVLLVTTRRGKKGEKPRISFSSAYTTGTPTIDLRPLNRQEYLDHIRDLYYDEAYLAPDYTQLNPAFDVVNRVDASMKDA